MGLLDLDAEFITELRVLRFTLLGFERIGYFLALPIHDLQDRSLGLRQLILGHHEDCGLFTQFPDFMTRRRRRLGCTEILWFPLSDKLDHLFVFGVLLLEVVERVFAP